MGTLHGRRGGADVVVAFSPGRRPHTARTDSVCGSTGAHCPAKHHWTGLDTFLPRANSQWNSAFGVAGAVRECCRVRVRNHSAEDADAGLQEAAKLRVLGLGQRRAGRQRDEKREVLSSGIKNAIFRCYVGFVS